MSEFPEIVEYEIVVTREGIMDEITLRIELTPQLSWQAAEESAQRLKERHKIKTNLTCKVKIEPTGDPAAVCPEGKTLP